MQSSYPNRLLDARPSLPQPSDILVRFRTLVLDGPDAIPVAPLGTPASAPVVDEAPTSDDAEPAVDEAPTSDDAEPGVDEAPTSDDAEPSDDAALEQATAPEPEESETSPVEEDEAAASDKADAEPG